MAYVENKTNQIINKNVLAETIENTSYSIIVFEFAGKSKFCLILYKVLFL
jgi:hypothetical protein